MHPHLTDEALNEYLDAALAPDERAEAAAHLAGCGACTARLAGLRLLFAQLEALPEATLTRDLTAAVLKALPAHAPAPARARRPTLLPWLAGAQALVALIIVILAGPTLALTLVTTLYGPRTSLGMLDLLYPLTTLFYPSSWLPAAQQWLAALLSLPGLPVDWLPLTGLAPLTIGLAVAGAAALWLVGNALLLGRPLTSRWRRRA